MILLMIYILLYLKAPELWELWYVPYYGLCRVYIIDHNVTQVLFASDMVAVQVHKVSQKGHDKSIWTWGKV